MNFLGKLYLTRINCDDEALVFLVNRCKKEKIHKVLVWFSFIYCEVVS